MTLWSRRNTVFRVKRGISNTSHGGGFTKDLVYFEGAYSVAKWLHQHDYVVSDLYLGRISIHDVEKAKLLQNSDSLQLPFFVTDDPLKYKEKLSSLIRENELAK